MTRLLTPLSLAALVALASPSFAQETNGDETAADAVQPSLGDDTPRPGDRHILSEHGAWKLRCITTNADADECRLAQLLFDDSGNPLVEISISPLYEPDEAVATATVITPLGTLLRDELGFAIGDLNVKRYPYALCSPVGCYSHLGLTQEELDGLKEEEQAAVMFVVIAGPSQRAVRAELNVPLDGFADGYEAAEEQFEKFVAAIEAAQAEN